MSKRDASRDEDRRKWGHPIQYLLLAIVIAAIGWPVVSCFRESSGGPPIEFIFPDGFRGPARMSQKPGGVEIAMKNGVYEVPMPKSGYLEVEDASFLQGWHEIRARFENGKEIPQDEGKASPDKLVFIWDGSVSSSASDAMGNTQWESFFVGTWREAYEKGGLKHEPRGQARAERTARIASGSSSVAVP